MIAIEANTISPHTPGARLGSIDFWQFGRPRDYEEAMFEAAEIAALLGHKVVFAVEAQEEVGNEESVDFG